MTTVANIATQIGREKSLKKTIESIYDQFDEINIYRNCDDDYDYGFGEKVYVLCGDDITDNGKFYFVEDYDPSDDVVYFTLDDDLIYPKTYVSDVLEALKEYPGHIITYHGRRLVKSPKYYRGGHKPYPCLGTIQYNAYVDVPGSGCSAWNLKDFYPSNLWYDDRKMMADLILAECAIDNLVKCICMAHDSGYFKHTENESTIYDHFRLNPTQIQDNLQAELYEKIKDRNITYPDGFPFR